jgi:hypothetical protein
MFSFFERLILSEVKIFKSKLIFYNLSSGSLPFFFLLAGPGWGVWLDIEERRGG